MVKKQYNCLYKSLLPALKKTGIYFAKFEELNSEQREYVESRFKEVFYPVLTPLAVDQSRPFPLLANKSLILAIRLEGTDEELFAVVQVPSVLPRIIEVPSQENRLYVFLEDIIIGYIDTYLPLSSQSVFRSA
jgi:polyphosphate kinase